LKFFIRQKTTPSWNPISKFGRMIAIYRKTRKHRKPKNMINNTILKKSTSDNKKEDFKTKVNVVRN